MFPIYCTCYLFTTFLAYRYQNTYFHFPKATTATIETDTIVESPKGIYRKLLPNNLRGACLINHGQKSRVVSLVRELFVV